MKSRIALSGLRSVFNSTLSELYSIEVAQADILAEVIPHISNPNLVEILKKHELETLSQIDKVKSILESLDLPSLEQKSKTIMAFYKEVEEALKNFDKGEELDLKIAASLRKVEHFEVGSYGTARIFAAHLDEHFAYSILEGIWKEEINADKNIESFILEFCKVGMAIG